MTEHTMNLVASYPTGAEMWVCAECLYRFVIVWHPYKKIVLMDGDMEAMHSGGKGGIVMSKPTITQADNVAGDILSDVWDYIDGLEFD